MSNKYTIIRRKFEETCNENIRMRQLKKEQMFEKVLTLCNTKSIIHVNKDEVRCHELDRKT